MGSPSPREGRFRVPHPSLGPLWGPQRPFGVLVLCWGRPHFPGGVSAPPPMTTPVSRPSAGLPGLT